MGNIAEIPYTELVERVQKLGRVGVDNLDRIRGAINDIYVREIPAKFDWNFLITESSLTTAPEYHTGSVSMSTGDTAVVLNSGTFPTDSNGRKIKFTGNDTVYDVVAYVNSTSLTINPAMQGASNLSGASYSLYKDRYSLASNFDRFPKPGGVYRWAGGRKQVLPEVQYANYINDAYQSTATTPSNTRLIGTDTIGCNIVELIPPPREQKVYGYDYLRLVRPLSETTQGTITAIGATSRTVTASGSSFFDAGTDGTYFLRVDNFGIGADSVWYRIHSIQSSNQLTLATVFGNSAAGAGANYTISQAPTFPSRLHIGLLYGALRQLTVDQNDPNAQFYHTQYAQVLSDAKKIYVSRPYSQEVDGIMTDYRYRR